MLSMARRGRVKKTEPTPSQGRQGVASPNRTPERPVIAGSSGLTVGVMSAGIGSSNGRRSLVVEPTEENFADAPEIFVPDEVIVGAEGGEGLTQPEFYSSQPNGTAEQGEIGRAHV